MTVKEMILQESNNCVHDSVTLYNGPTVNSDVIVKICAEYNDSVTSTGSTVLIVFKSYGLNNTGRFSISWTFVAMQGEQCGRPNPIVSRITERLVTRDYFISCIPGDCLLDQYA